MPLQRLLRPLRQMVAHFDAFCLLTAIFCLNSSMQLSDAYFAAAFELRATVNVQQECDGHVV